MRFVDIIRPRVQLSEEDRRQEEIIDLILHRISDPREHAEWYRTFLDCHHPESALRRTER